jgi:hypothetical protein
MEGRRVPAVSVKLLGRDAEHCLKVSVVEGNCSVAGRIVRTSGKCSNGVLRILQPAFMSVRGVLASV